MERSAVERFAANEHGAVAPIIAVSLFALVALGGIAFDYTRMVSLDTELQKLRPDAEIVATGADQVRRILRLVAREYGAQQLAGACQPVRPRLPLPVGQRTVTSDRRAIRVAFGGPAQRATEDHERCTEECADPAVPRDTEIDKEWTSLSYREQAVARLVVEGLTNQQIAKRIRCSPETVKFHLRNIFRKLEIGSRVEIARFVLASEGAA